MTSTLLKKPVADNSAVINRPIISPGSFLPPYFNWWRNAEEITPFMVKETKCGMYQRYLPPEYAFHRIVLTKMIVCPGHIHSALHADTLFTILQDSTTHGTLTREEEMDKRKEPDFKFVFHRIVLSYSKGIKIAQFTTMLGRNRKETCEREKVNDKSSKRGRKMEVKRKKSNIFLATSS